MLRSLLKQSIVLGKRVEKNKKSWYKYENYIKMIIDKKPPIWAVAER